MRGAKAKMTKSSERAKPTRGDGRRVDDRAPWEIELATYTAEQRAADEARWKADDEADGLEDKRRRIATAFAER